MNAFYLWLQNEVNSKDLSKDLYRMNLTKSYSFEDSFAFIKDQATQIMPLFNSINDLILSTGVEVVIEELPNIKVHALYNPNINKVIIDRKWLDFLSSELGSKKAYDFCLIHELCHVLEDVSWFPNLKRKERSIYLETLAYLVSQMYIKTDIHPSVFDYKFAIENNFYTEDDLINYLKGVIL